MISKTAVRLAAAAFVVALAASSQAFADGMPRKKTAAAPPPEPKQEWALTANIAVTSEYVFRGFSQTGEEPAVQGGVDFTYKWFYAGLWSSNLDFGRDVTPAGISRPVAPAELDLYMGIKPVVGPVTFDFGVIYYTYPRALDGGIQANRELDYVELKLGASGEIYKGGTVGFTAFYSPEYTNQQGSVWTFEGTFSHAFAAIRDITPTFSVLVGYQMGDSLRYSLITANGDDSYFYWNAGVTLGFGDRFSLDLRYWDTDISNTNGFCTGQLFQCDERFVATAKFTY